MRLSPKTRIGDLLRSYPFLLEFLPSVSPKFAMLKNPILRKTVGSAATLAQAAALGGVPLDDLMRRVAEKIRGETRQDVEIATDSAEPEALADSSARREVMKDIIRDLHAGGDFDAAKRRFGELIRDVDATEIAAMEQRLISEGMPETEVKRLCDVHVKVFQESLDRKDAPRAPEGHPVHTFMLENRACENLLDKVESVLEKIGTPPEPEAFRSYAKNLGKLRMPFLK